jgi:hypothetical protein
MLKPGDLVSLKLDSSLWYVRLSLGACVDDVRHVRCKNGSVMLVLYVDEPNGDVLLFSSDCCVGWQSLQRVISYERLT